MSLTDYLQRRETWRADAPGALSALRGGDLTPAARMLSSWRFAGRPAWLEAVAGQLLEAPATPSPAATAVTLGAPPVSGVATAHEWRDAAWERPGDAPAEVDPQVWALAELAALGWLVEETTRAPWLRLPLTADPRADERAAALWRAWVDLSIFAHEDAWDALTLKPMLRAFAAVLRGRRVPEDRVRYALADAREGWLPFLYGGSSESMGWRELAVRVIEGSGEGPVDALASALPSERWGVVARCAVTRGYGPDTARLVWGGSSTWLTQARDLERSGTEGPAVLDDLLDLHVASRLVQRWREPAATAPERSWNVVRNNRGRARARLRAVLRELPADQLVQRLVAVPGLAERTRQAAARFGRDWAWQCHQQGLTFADDRVLDPACHDSERAVAAFSEEELLQLQAWTLNVILKERLPHLESWTWRKGDAGVDMKDSTWGRLLSDDLPSGLRDAGPGASRDDGLQRLRAELVEHMPAMLRRLQPCVERVAAIEIRPRRMQVPFEAAIGGHAHPAVKPLLVRHRSYIEAARRALPALRARAEEPDDTDGDER